VLWSFGPPAAGKSTLAHRRAEELFGSEGSVCVDGDEIRDRHPAFRDVTQHGLESHVLHKDAWEVLKATGVVEGAELASTEDVESFLAGRRIHSSKPCVCLVGDANLRHMFARKSRNQVKCLKQDTYWKHLLYYIIRDPLQPAVGHA
ncbi:unnamed protein product, partial [Durusdinium trenchii]